MAPSIDKKIMSEKVARVQEVVKGITRNDIILALHSFDLDVERTIQALCEDKSAVLGEWEGGPTKSKKNKKKSTATNASAAIPSVSTQKVDVVLPTVAALTSQPKKVANKNGFQSSSHKENASGLDLLASYETEASQIAASFSQECEHGKKQIETVFKNLRQLLTDREKTLVTALAKSQQDGEKLIQERKKTAKALLARGQCTGSDAVLPADMKSFTAQKRLEQQLSSATVFEYDITKLVQSIANFGRVVEVNKSGTTVSSVVSGPSPIAAIKHANSHSSIGSSDVDSGLGGHISPVSVPEEKKPTAPKAHVASGGIQMSSDGLSASQLEALQKNLQAQLLARGIDASLVTGGAGVIPHRPRNKGPRVDHKKAQQNQQKKGPELSILS